MFNFSFGELLVLGVIGLIVIGPKQLPRAANILGRVYREFRRAIQDVTQDVTQAAKDGFNQSTERQPQIAPPSLSQRDLRTIDNVMKELGK